MSAKFPGGGGQLTLWLAAYNLDMKELYSKYNFLKSKRQPKNLKKLLTKARFDSIPINPEVKICKENKCGLCTYLIEGNSFQFNCGTLFEIKQSLSSDVKMLSML